MCHHKAKSKRNQIGAAILITLDGILLDCGPAVQAFGDNFILSTQLSAEHAGPAFVPIKTLDSVNTFHRFCPQIFESPKHRIVFIAKLLVEYGSEISSFQQKSYHN